MQSWVKLAVGVAVPAAAILFVILTAACLHSRRRRQKILNPAADVGLPRSKTVAAKESLFFYRSDVAGLRFHQLDRHDRARSRRQQQQQQCHQHRQLHQPGSDFSWEDHPGLVAEAVEGGWSRFAFMGRSDSPPRPASLLASCVACDHGRPPCPGAEVRWEVPPGASELMQTVRLDPGGAGGCGGAAPPDGEGPYCAAVMGLPLPGPPLGADRPSFPQEAYFEITVMRLLRPQRRQPQPQLPARRSKRVKDSSGEGDRRKLINPDDPAPGSFPGDSAREPEPKLPDEEQSNISSSSDSSKELADAVIWIGLTRGNTPTEKPPGSHPGSIGFSSNGSVYLDGIQLVLESGSARWGTANGVVGCGFDPGKKTVFFTMDAVLLHVIHCRSEAFAGPLYPALAANADAAVSVNLGQCAFRYPPANAQRTPNPCFLRPSASAHIRYDDSRELFSMGRIDSRWRDVVSGGKARQLTGAGGTAASEEDDRGDSSVVDIDADSDLFEISLSR